MKINYIKILLIATIIFFGNNCFAAYELINSQTDSSGSVSTNTNTPTLVIGSFIAGGSGTMYNPDLKMYGWTNSPTNGFTVLLATNNTNNGSGVICRWDLSNDYSSGSYPTTKTSEPLFLHVTTDTCNNDPIASPGSGVTAGNTYYWKIFTAGTTNIATDVSNANMFFELGTDLDLAPDISITSPVDGETLQDFQQWAVSWANQPTSNKQISVMYSDHLTKLEDCQDFPITGSYADCINGNPKVWIDYGIVISSATGTNAHIFKNTPLVIGKTYYAIFNMQENDGFGSFVAQSEIISFTVGVPGKEDIPLTQCTLGDIFCYAKNAFLFSLNYIYTKVSNLLNAIFASNVFDYASYFPFNYYAQIQDYFMDANLPGSESITWEYTVPHGYLTGVKFGGVTAIKKLLSTNTQNTIKDLISTSLWLAFIFGILSQLRGEIKHLRNMNHN